MKARRNTDPIDAIGRMCSNAAVVLAAMAVAVELLWIWSFYYGGSTQGARVATFLSFFPSWLHGTWSSSPHGFHKISTMQVGFSVLSFFLAAIGLMAMDKATLGRRLVNVGVLLVCPPLLLLKAFEAL